MGKNREHNYSFINLASKIIMKKGDTGHNLEEVALPACVTSCQLLHSLVLNLNSSFPGAMGLVFLLIKFLQKSGSRRKILACCN